MRTWSKVVLVLFAIAASVGLVTALMFLPDKGEQASDGGALAMAMLWMFVAAPVSSLIGLIVGVLIVRRAGRRHWGEGWTTYDSIARSILVLAALAGLVWAGNWAHDAYHRNMADTREAVLEGYLDNSASRRFFVRWSDDTTRLFGSALLGNRGTVDSMLRHGIPVDKRDRLGHTPLMWAAKVGKTEVVEALLQHGANPNAADLKGFTALHLMADSGHAEPLPLLLRHGADINCRDRAGRTPLILLANLYYPADGFARALLDHGADVRAVDKHGHTALGLAAGTGREALVRMLLSHGADPNTRDLKGLTPLMVASSSSSADQVVSPGEVVDEDDYAPIVEILVNGGAHVDARDASGRTALMMAAKAGHPKSVKILLDHGADPSLRDSRGRTARMLARKDGASYRIVRELLRKRTAR